MTFEIRRISPAEYAAVGNLVVGSYRHDGFLTRADGSANDDYAKVLHDTAGRATHAELWLAVDGGHVLGCVTWCPAGSTYRELATQADQGELRALAVAPQARGRGVGRTLVRHCIERANADGLHEILLCSLPTMTTAHHLYESVGFSRRPDLDWSPVENVDLWAFSLTITGRP